ncbi:MAG: HAD hydrolase family protein [Planctomycetota bacterium]
MSRLIGNKTLPAISEMGVWLWWPTDNAYVRDPAITASNMHAVHAASEWIETEFGSTGVVQQPGKTCSISLYHADTEQLMEIRPRLEAHFREHAWPFRVTASWLWINLELEHVSKATGIDRLTNATGIPTQRLMGIGDTMGDLAIRERVEWFACPANAQDALKQHADYVSEAHEAHGVLDILDRAVGV